METSEPAQRKPSRFYGDPEYHESAIEYNREMRKFALQLSKKVKHREVSRWCWLIARQHKEHVEYHQEALEKALRRKKWQQEKRQQKWRFKKKPESGDSAAETVEAVETDAEQAPDIPAIENETDKADA